MKKVTAAKKKKVMIVDDEVALLEIIKENLESTGKYEVQTLPDAKDIIQEVHHFAPDVILLDLLMPAVGGIEVCQMLNDDQTAKGIPVIVISALDKEADKLNAYEVGVIDYLVKPVKRDELLAKIEQALELK